MLRLKFVRIDRGLTQKQVAQLSQLNTSQICLIEQGQLIPRPDQLKRISKALVVPADRLLDHVSAASLGDGAEARDAQAR